MNALTQIATYLNVSPNRIKRCEEWAKVYFVVIEGKGGRFVSKGIVTMKNAELASLENKKATLLIIGVTGFPRVEHITIKKAEMRQKHVNYPNGEQALQLTYFARGTRKTVKTQFNHDYFALFLGWQEIKGDREQLASLNRETALANSIPAVKGTPVYQHTR
jgi:hypothetical protein